MHITALPGDYYNFDSARQRLTGERTGRSFQLGGAVRVQVARVDLDDRKIDLELIEAKPPKKAKGSRKAAKPGQKHRPKKGKKPAKSKGKTGAEKALLICSHGRSLFQQAILRNRLWNRLLPWATISTYAIHLRNPRGRQPAAQKPQDRAAPVGAVRVATTSASPPCWNWPRTRACRWPGSRNRTWTTW